MHTDRPLAALVVILASMALLGLIDNTVSVIARDIGLWQFHLMRAVLAIALMGALAGFGLVRLGAKRRWAVALRGGFTAISMLIYFGSLAFMPIGQVAAGLFTSPIWIMLISAGFLGSRIGPARILAATVGFAGVILVLDPFANGFSWVSLVPLGSGLFYALGGIATRQWCLGETAFAMLFWFFLWLGVFGLVGVAGMSLWPHTVPSGADGFILRGLVLPTQLAMGLTVVQAVGSIVAVGLIFKGYQLGEASYVAIYEYSFLIFAAIWSWILWGEGLAPQAALGIAFIILSGATIAFRSRRTGG
jgi:drug/metabolite transporter (DMT)-like permease